mmetsp:Transcript_3615/g.7911  ORF Transcript_3615/g.7911 Transcript_3615/m.7911 type:complete len:280 (-) Transcript_3615:373-1212(-)
MNSCITSLVLALASPALAFQPSNASTRPSVALHNTLRDMASYPDAQQGQRMMNDLEAFDRNGAFSRSPQGGMGGRPDMMSQQGGMGGRPDMMSQQGMMPQQGGMGGMYGGEYGGGGNPNPFARRGNPNDRMYTQDGFDPYSAYGTSFGTSQSDRRSRGPGPQGMGYYGEPGMMGGGGRSMIGGGGGGPNGVHNDNTIEGFSYSSRVREQREFQGGAGPAWEPGFDYEMGAGFEDPMMGQMGGGMGYEGGMEYEQQFPGPNGGGGYGGFEGEMDMGRMGP